MIVNTNEVWIPRESVVPHGTLLLNQLVASPFKFANQFAERHTSECEGILNPLNPFTCEMFDSNARRVEQESISVSEPPRLLSIVLAAIPRAPLGGENSNS